MKWHWVSGTASIGVLALTGMLNASGQCPPELIAGCSVENIAPPENQDVVGDGLQEHGAALTRLVAGAERVAQPPFDHAEDGFDLPALSVAAAVGWATEVTPHQAPIAARRRFGGLASDLGWNDGTHIQLVADELMRPLGIEAGITQ